MVAAIPVLATSRLTLRPFVPADAADVRRLAGDRAVADTTLNIPHPYEAGMAEAWIAAHPMLFARGENLVLAIGLPQTPVIGAISLRFSIEHAHAELGYWIGVPYWGQGYATEAARAIVAHAFDAEPTHRVYAQHVSRNQASGRVMQKIGMRHEGRLRDHVRRWDRFEDVEVYAILRPEWDASQRTTPR
jgi:RimJ/RimL family protein N-acetyltransferase